jgi:hypothetical protein
MRCLVVPLTLAALCLTACQTSVDTPPVAVEESASPTASPTPSVAAEASASATPSTPSPTSTETPSLLASPDFRSKSKCSVEAGKYPTMNKGVRFTAQTTVNNRGNIGGSIQVKVIWTGKAQVRRARTISVGYGKSVKVILNAPTNAGGVTAYRANGSSRCEVTVKVLSFLGKPHRTT